jgi:hypothetical protein
LKPVLCYTVLWPPGRVHSAFNPPLTAGVARRVHASQLTARGFEQQVSLGESLRQLYVHEHELLPKKLHAADVYVRSTDVPRTRESALGMLRGLYPPGARPRGEALRTWRKPLVIEDMVANALKCPRCVTVSGWRAGAAGGTPS